MQVQRAGAGTAVFVITHERETAGCKLGAYLVRPSGKQTDMQQTACCQTAQWGNDTGCLLAIACVDVFVAAGIVFHKLVLQPHGRVMGPASVHPAEIFFVELPLAESILQTAQHGVACGDEKQAGSIFVEPVRRRRPEWCVGKMTGQPGSQGVALAAAAVGGQSGGFVEDEEIGRFSQEGWQREESV